MSRNDGDDYESPLAQARRARTAPEFNRALNLLRDVKGLSFQKVSDYAKPFGETARNLPKSTAHLMCTKKTLPKSPEQVELFVRGCLEPPEVVKEWVAEWRRLVSLEVTTKQAEQRTDRLRKPERPRPAVEAPPTATRAEEAVEDSPVHVEEPAAAVTGRKSKATWWRRLVAGLLFTLLIGTITTVTAERADLTDVRDMVMTVASGAGIGTPFALLWLARTTAATTGITPHRE